MQGRGGRRVKRKSVVIDREQAERLTPEQREFVRQNLGLVGLHLRKRVHMPRCPMRDRETEDLFQEGCLALMRACVSHDPRKHGPFPSYALARIRARIHAALHHTFSLVHIPLKQMGERPVRVESRTGDLRPARPPAIQPLPHDAAPESSGSNSASHTDAGPETPITIRHALRDCFEQAVERGLRGLARRRCPRRNRLKLMRRLAAERLLVTDAAARTTLRRIAQEAGLSKTRAFNDERRLEAAVARQLAADSRVPMLLRLARQDPAGLDGPLDIASYALAGQTCGIHAGGKRSVMDVDRAAASRA
jgi:hypothetical protein